MLLFRPKALPRTLISLNPLNPHDAWKQHFTSLKTDLILLQPRVFEWKFLWNWFTNALQFSLILSPTSNHLHPLQVENCDRNSRLVVDEDDNVKSGLIRLKHWRDCRGYNYGVRRMSHRSLARIFCSSLVRVRRVQSLSRYYLFR